MRIESWRWLRKVSRHGLNCSAACGNRPYLIKTQQPQIVASVYVPNRCKMTLNGNWWINSRVATCPSEIRKHRKLDQGRQRQIVPSILCKNLLDSKIGDSRKIVWMLIRAKKTQTCSKSTRWAKWTLKNSWTGAYLQTRRSQIPLAFCEKRISRLLCYRRSWIGRLTR